MLRLAQGAAQGAFLGIEGLFNRIFGEKLTSSRSSKRAFSRKLSCNSRFATATAA